MAIPILDNAAFVIALLDAVDDAGAAIAVGAGKIIGQLVNVASALFTIYVVMWGWAMIRGMVSEPTMDFFMRIVKLGVIFGLALNLGRYDEYVVTFLWNTPEKIFEAITGTSTKDTLLINQVLSIALKVGGDYMAEASTLGMNGIPNLMLLGMGAVTWGAGVVLTGAVAATIVVAKFMLSILLSVGPLFILLIIFEPTKRLFDAWLGQVINYVVLIILLGFAIQLVLGVLLKALGIFMISYMAAYMLSLTTSPSISEGIGLITMFGICSVVFMKVPAIAEMVGRSISINTYTGNPRK